MLRLTWGGRERGAAPRPVAVRTQRRHFVFGGVAFELLAEYSGKQRAIPPESVSYCLPGQDPRAIADVVCVVHTDSSLSGGQQSLPALAAAGMPDNTVTWRRRVPDDAFELRGPGLEAWLECLGPRRYVLTARIAPGHTGMLTLLRGVSSAILHREGGLVLHAAAIELDGAGFLFVGPSGAGKSTAVQLTRGGRCFAFDHVAVLPAATGWLAWGLPGGSAVDAPSADGVVYPLAAVMRVRQAPAGSEPRITPLDGAGALFALRESVECADDSREAEDVYLRSAMELSSRIPVATIATVLGRSATPALREWIATAASQGSLLA